MERRPILSIRDQCRDSRWDGLDWPDSEGSAHPVRSGRTAGSVLKLSRLHNADRRKRTGGRLAMTRDVRANADQSARPSEGNDSSDGVCCDKEGVKGGKQIRSAKFDRADTGVRGCFSS